MITDIEDFFTRGCGRCARFDTPDCSVRQWTAGLDDLRRICRELQLEETVKWAHPCYMHAGRNIAIIGALRGDFRLSFFNAGLMRDPEGVLERQGENTRHPDMIRFTRSDQVSEMEGIIRAYLQEAMAYAEKGLKQPKEEGGFDLPEELVEAHDADPELAEAFHALTPGRQRSYVIALSSAKTSQTRINRIAKYRDKIIAGKGAMER
ncbi:MAG: YdeI/OmpD-associated family protein [Hoeflea sp.]|uniref:YdeI/OmpD-associated family protein n=1 Tax=Hoeflea sp. TaxID=1940281 RepID=UPI001D94A9F0|nr:YdeI/OmpD-associated family protein [Hoeflea sp.]MBU4528431.1 YdeI/OmpD-associated family protein [Alphaproteobacteria bacterium]MBU4543100.1 YdeI/OmpD-associated family protein [Alphaproteobacteria bacterium]MBU4551791.1 YdeI/OmpD-associated family protein [Alphaproteobacteria bacterium]MBV1723686.1 YdeI/OmpD-associated family protein [Hoeflea sp.]MBV1762002.1 YdeI/OmpD-associated family protein [Hoeflea sp.]